METLRQVKVSDIVIRSNYRKKYNEEKIQAIVTSMKAKGFRKRYPLAVYAMDDKFILIDGHTRYHAALRLNDPEFLVWVDVDDTPTDEEFYTEQIVANELRDDPDPVSQGAGYENAIKAGSSIEKLMAQLNHPRDYIQRRMDLLLLDPDIQHLVSTGNLGLKFGAALSRLDRNYQIRVFAKYRDKPVDLDTFQGWVNVAYTEQCQPEFNWGIVDSKIDAATIACEPKLTIAQLKKHLADERSARKADREFAIAKYAALRIEVAQLKAQLAQKVA